MTIDDLKLKGLENELKFSASRSSGAGGQNVNKVNTKVELRFHVQESQCLSDEEKETLFAKLTAQISNDGYIIVVSQSERSQIQNKEIAVEKFYKLLLKAFAKRKKRKPTAPTKQAKEKRLQSKRIQAEKKDLRKKLE